MKALIFILLVAAQTTIAQGQSTSTKHDSLLKRVQHVSSADSLCAAIDTFIFNHQTGIQIDTVELNGLYTINSVPTFLAAATDTLSFKQTAQAIVITYNKKLLKILLPTQVANRSLGVNLDAYYFKENQLKCSIIQCSDFGSRMGSCGGLYSTYYNYFSNNICTYSRVVENEVTHGCGCGSSYVPSIESINNWMLIIDNAVLAD